MSCALISPDNGLPIGQSEAFMNALARLPEGFSEGDYRGRRWSVSVKRSSDLRRNWLYAEQLGGTEIVSFNLYRPDGRRPLLKPCEMSAEKVAAFVLEFQPATNGTI